jgi:beta-glucanase (GH16 family)
MHKIRLLWLSLMLLLVVTVSAQDEPLALELLIADFETGLPVIIEPGGAAVGYVTWGSEPENVVLSARQIVAGSALALPLPPAAANTVLALDYQIGSWGGFTHAFTDGTDWTSMDWTDYNAFTFWLYGNASGGQIQIDLFDNRNPDQPGDTPERFFYRITDDVAGWRQFTIPFALFARRTDFQPSGAPDDGLGLDQVAGYAFGLPAGKEAQRLLLDQVGLTTVEAAEVLIWQGTLSAIPTPPTLDLEAENLWDARAWNLIWSDEFEGATGTPIDTSKWTAEIGGHGWGNREWQYYTDRVENAALDGDGNLAIVAREETLPNTRCHYGTCRYTSARLITRDKFEFTYGRVEARIRVGFGQGIWPAFWMLGADFGEVGWPNSGEIDILEYIGREPNKIFGTVHGPQYSGEKGVGQAYESAVPFADDFHVYAIDWDPAAIRWYVDGTLYHMITPDSLRGNRWVFDHDFFLLLNMAVGGNWPGYPDETTQFPQTMLVDYVRVYQLAGE